MSLFEFPETEKDRAAAVEAVHAANIARAVFHRRLDAGLSQGELAKIAGTTQARVSELESLKGDPKLSTLGRVAYALGCVIDMVEIPAAESIPTPKGFVPLESKDWTATALGSARNGWAQAASLLAHAAGEIMYG